VRVCLDITQLVREPRRSGIQRAERELMRHWPRPGELVPCRFDPGLSEMRALPRAVMDELCADAPPGGLQEELCRLARHLAEPGPVIPRSEPLLCAELFDDRPRAEHYVHRKTDPVFWLVYDFLPWLHPEWFTTSPGAALMPYIRAMRAVPHHAFISAATQRDFADRVVRRPCAGPVIPLGADGIGLQRQRFDPAKREFVMLGTLEARKNAAAAMLAFRRLWDEGVDASLTLIGATEKDAREEQALARELAAYASFRHVERLPDAGVRDALSRARAMLFPSEGEGYGIPPMEALHAGIPVIVWSGLPALEDMPALGQIRLAEITPDSIAVAVRSMLDDAMAARLWAEAETMPTPTWREFAAHIAAWITDRAPVPARR